MKNFDGMKNNKYMDMTGKLSGIVVPMVTPLLADREVDFDAVARLVEHLVGGGVHGIFILGTTGEAQSLSKAQRYALTEYVGKAIDGRAAFLVGVSDTSIEDAVELAGVAARSGAVGVVSTPPYYFSPSQSDMVNWFTALADASPLPVYMYNMPSHVKVSIAPETVMKLAKHPNIKGLKDSSHNMTYFQTISYLTKDQEDFVLFVGPEEQTAQAVVMGAAGGVNGGANMFPELYVKLYNAVKAGDCEQMRRLQKAVLHISTALYNMGDGPSSYLQGLKGALELLGLCNRTLALPYTPMSDEKMAALKEALAGISAQEWN